LCFLRKPLPHGRGSDQSRARQGKQGDVVRQSTAAELQNGG